MCARLPRLLALGCALAVAVLAAAGCGSSSSGSSSASGSGARASGSSSSAAHSHHVHSSLQLRGVAKVRHLASLGLPIYCAGPHGNALAFTFDDGPGPYTHYALKKLRQAHERATFFAVGRSINYFPGWLQRETHLAEIGDHTYTHPLLTQLSSEAAQSEIQRTETLIQGQIGQPVSLFRPPYGGRNTSIDAIARRLGLLEILWNIDSADSLGANYAGIIKNVEAGMHPGSIILMHENRGQTIRALTTILPELHRRHLRSVTVGELLASDPPSRAQLREGPQGCSGGAAVHGNSS